jgi:radical SAM peptide maturase (CXXX-repeat target family)
MPREVAYRAIDFFLKQPCKDGAAVLEFIGGEPTLEMGLIRDVAQYFKNAVGRLKHHPWRSAYVFMIDTNGTTYRSKDVQQFLWENRYHTNILITIDGSKRKHDMHRRFKDGQGSYDLVAENVKLWLRQYPNSPTKVTFASDDLPYTCESIVHLWDMGIETVPANVVFENVWKPGDPEIFESQLRELADIALNQGYWRTHNTSLFWIPPNGHDESDRNWCGTGKMIAVDSAGNLYPCLRFMDFSLSTPGRCGRSVGTIYDGFDEDKLRAYRCLRKSLQSSKECLECDMEDHCSWCSAHNYDAACSDTIFERKTYLCEMHKAQCRANQYYWQQLRQKHGLGPEDIEDRNVQSCGYY